MDEQTLVDKRALDALTENYESFTLEDKDGHEAELHLYPLQLGRLAMISRRLINLDMALSGNADNDVMKMWRICADKPHEVAEIIAIATLRTKSDVENELKARTELIEWSPTMTTPALSNILSSIVFKSYYGDFTIAIRSVKTLQVVITPPTEAERIATTEGAASGDK